MKKNDELSQRDVQKLEAVRKMIGCSAEFRIKTIASIVKNVITESFTDDDAQKAALLLANKKFCVPECTRNYRILCETVIKNPLLCQGKQADTVTSSGAHICEDRSLTYY